MVHGTHLISGVRPQGFKLSLLNGIKKLGVTIPTYYVPLIICFSQHCDQPSNVFVLQAPLHAAGSDGSGLSRIALDRRRSQLLQLRCSLARCLKDAVTPAGPGAAAVGAAKDQLLVSVGHQSQVGHSGYGVQGLCPS